MPANHGLNAPACQEMTDGQFRSKDMNSIDRKGHGAKVNQARGH